MIDLYHRTIEYMTHDYGSLWLEKTYIGLGIIRPDKQILPSDPAEDVRRDFRIWCAGWEGVQSIGRSRSLDYIEKYQDQYLKMIEQAMQDIRDYFYTDWIGGHVFDDRDSAARLLHKSLDEEARARERRFKKRQKKMLEQKRREHEDSAASRSAENP